MSRGRNVLMDDNPDTRSTAPVEPIAIVGMSCRLPGANDPDSLWRLLRNGTDTVTKVPAGRWQPADSARCRWGAFVSDVEGFDAAFFGISPNEASAADPQQRLVLELAWEALENARIIPAELRGTSGGVFLGAASNDYPALRDRLGPGGASPHAYAGTSRSIIANRVSYFLKLQGPSLTIDTGQSSSLVAVHLACESLRRGESALALAGGVNLNLLGETTAVIGSLGVLSPDGRCRVFDRDASGYVRGEGGALVVLKPLGAALRDGDVVHCVILGGAVNNDGGGDGLTAPSSGAQQRVIQQACARSGLRARDVQYVELHGTGTRVGDPVEAAALGAALGQGRPRTRPLLVGSVKTNIGHLEGAAGIAGLLKVALSIKNRELPASLHFTVPNPAIPLDDLRLRVVRRLRKWPLARQAAVAGVSSFGMGGTNCHVVLSEAPAAAPREIARAVHQDAEWLLSARSVESLRSQSRRLRGWLDEFGGSPDAVALSLVRTRTAFEHRAVILNGNRLEALDALADGRPHRSVVTGAAVAGRPAFVFPGQGSQWATMASSLLGSSPEFSESIAACAAALDPFISYSLPDLLRGRPGAPTLDRTDTVQPALWAVMVSLARLWQAHGVEPDMVIGHSQGEIAAATIAGALSLSDGARVVALRSQAIARIAWSGGMMSVMASPHEVESAIASRGWDATVAAVNGPRSVVVSAAAVELEQLERYFNAVGCRTKQVPVTYASHSPAVDQISDEILAALAPIRPMTARTGFVSSLTGGLMDTAGLDAAYWCRSLRQPVHFGLAVQAALGNGCGLFIECSPHPTLIGAVTETIEQSDHPARAVGTLRRSSGGMDQFRRALAEAYVCGASVDWTGPCDAPRSALMSLPTYGFDRRRYELATAEGALGSATQKGAAGHGRPAAATPPTAEVRRNSRLEVQELVLGVTADILGYQNAGEIAADWAFKDLGVDSAAAIELRNRLQSATGYALPISLVFDYPTPQRLIGYLHTLADGGQPAVGEAQSAHSGNIAEPVAIVGIGCRYPGGVTSPADLWQLVTEGREAIGEFPVNRGWDLDALFAGGPGGPGTSDTRFGGFLPDVDLFDPGFFGISPREAAAMDPQQRLLLEVCWEAFEQGGIDPRSLRGSRTGVFIGAMATDYGPRLHHPTPGADGHRLTGTALSVVSGRIAYTFSLMGPALTVDTACSSSLVALHLAVQALRRGECSLALAGGVTVMASPGVFVEQSRLHGLASDGRCKAFSAAADGTGWAEGAGVLVLERLSDALRARREILAVINGSAVNQDGRSNGLTAPSGLSQEQVVRDALADARLVPADVDVIEGHGTGTTLGDPIEVRALIATYGQARPKDRPVWLGSVKSNIGHAQAAAGVAGVIKMVWAVRHGLLPPTLHAEEPTSHVDWSAGNIRLLAKQEQWTRAGRPAFAGISSFGISGTNAHVIIGEPPARTPDAEPTAAPAWPLVWVISARTRAALRAQAARFSDFAATAVADDLAAAAPVLARRARFSCRAVVMAADRSQLLDALAALADGAPHPSVVEGVAADDVRPVFVFPGQGTQWARMAVDLLDAHSGFREQLRLCDEALSPHTGWSVLDVLQERNDAPPLEGSDVIQPVLFAVMVSLAALWQSAGVEPSAVIGHSQGEIAAACAAGALSLEEAARVVALRSKALMKLTGTGGMLAVHQPPDQVQEMLTQWPDRLWVAIMSGPGATVVGGDLDALDQFAAAYGEQEQIYRLAVDYAAHTPHVEALRDELLAVLDGVEPRPSAVSICSSLTGELIDPREMTADYWYRGLRHPVQFTRAIGSLAGSGWPLFVEVSPHPVLTRHVQAALQAAGAPGAAVGSLRRGSGGWQQFLRAAAQAFVLGTDIDWRTLLGPVPMHHRDPPSYAFERLRFWLDEDISTSATANGMAAAPRQLLSASVPLATGNGYLLTGRLARGTMPWLADHEVAGAVLLPGTAFVEMALEAAAAAGCDLIEELIIEVPAILPERGGVSVQLLVGRADEQGRCGFTVHTRLADDPEARWTRHASGTLTVGRLSGNDVLMAWPPPGSVAVDLTGAYERLARHGYAYGPAFQGLAAAWQCGNDVAVEVRLPGHLGADSGRFALHPALLDAALHYPLLTGLAAAEQDDLLLPFSWNGVHVATPGADTLRVRISGFETGRVSLTCYGRTGQQVARIGALILRPAAKSDVAQRADVGASLHAVEWVNRVASRAHPAGQRWAAIGTGSQGDSLAAELVRSGADVIRGHDLISLAGATVEMPSVVVYCIPDIDATADVPSAAREVASQVLDLVQTWVGDERFAGRRLVFVTRNALGGTEVSPGALGAVAAWGLVRSAQAEHPGCFALVDVATGPLPTALASAVAAAESQLLVRDGTVLAPDLVRREVLTAAPAVPAQGTVLITGGTGELGGLVAQWLAEQHGVAHLLLLSRRGPRAPGAAELAARLEGLGTAVTVTACDVADRGALAAVLADIPADRPLTGVIHAAGMLDDATVERLSAAHLDRVFRPKVDAAWHLHELTQELPLSMFVLFSSVAGLLGLPGQANYAAANTFLDGLAVRRRRSGLPAVSIAWGPWDADGGMAGRLAQADAARLARAGLAPLSTQQGLDLLGAALAGGDPAVVAAHWDDPSTQGAAVGLLPPTLRRLVPATRPSVASAVRDHVSSGPDGWTGALPARLGELAATDAQRLLVDLVRSHVSEVLAYPRADDVDVDRAVIDLGIDSLGAVELRNRLNALTGLKLAGTLIYDHPTVTALAGHLHNMLTQQESGTRWIQEKAD
jgi:acyl transferase domain-containing protein